MGGDGRRSLEELLRDVRRLAVDVDLVAHEIGRLAARTTNLLTDARSMRQQIGWFRIRTAGFTKDVAERRRTAQTISFEQQLARGQASDGVDGRSSGPQILSSVSRDEVA